MIFAHEGAGPAIIAPLVGTTAQMIAEQACAAERAGADIVEWRIDFLLDAHNSLSLASLTREIVQDILSQTSIPILLTVRTAEQGGEARITPGRYRLLIAEVLDALMQVDAPADRIGLDIEYWFDGAQALAERAQEQGFTVVISHHDWIETPDPEVLYIMFTDMFEIPGTIAKLAVTAHSDDDVTSLFAVCDRIASRHKRPIIAIAMGEAGVRSRFDGWKHGSIATFATVGERSAPGQPSIAEVREYLATQT
ncbi:MAG: type I 3-dehydroquinate dehydratase [Actinomycetaceae bacterium]|nr:type I 3-dehydroquinate dehydratase [Arcanobacterium sp.]MDD7505661.1 type I 3-dehydroquinate dehydratase [Actinomycetaceae bacterium]MDY6143446.1 type I 3-dehydroquinate dehydratase [Arcanobacterium sp.]